jgi:hypothetical protein
MLPSIAALVPQNFSIPAGYNEVITFDVNPAVTDTLAGTTIYWRVYATAFGIPNFGAPPGTPPLIAKDSIGGIDIVGIDSPLSFTVQMYTADTLMLLRNYYHEATIVAADGENLGGSWGIMTVVEAINFLPASP